MEYLIIVLLLIVYRMCEWKCVFGKSVNIWRRHAQWQSGTFFV